MSQWSVEQARAWYASQPWLVGCNFLPGTAINQLEMWQADTYDRATIDRELGWAASLGFNVVRVYLHDLVWRDDRAGFIQRIDDFLAIAQRHGQRAIVVLFDDCHRPEPLSGPQPLPVRGVHNSGWVQSPGRSLMQQFAQGTAAPGEVNRLEAYVMGVLEVFAHDDRVLLWDLYNEPGQNGAGDDSNTLLKMTWRWAQAARPTQPLTSCLDGSIGAKNLAVNAAMSDIITFHWYEGRTMDVVLQRVRDTAAGRPVICTEYMARELGTTFEHCLPLFKEYRMGCLNWGLVMGKSQTHFNWGTVKALEAKRAAGDVVRPGEPFPEPTLWFHDIFRADGTPYDAAEVAFIRKIMGRA